MMRVRSAPTVSSSADDARENANAGAEVVLPKVPRRPVKLDPIVSDGPCGDDMTLLKSCFIMLSDSLGSLS
jgi:hypothetical protein